jgi:hypothetical protein
MDGILTMPTVTKSAAFWTRILSYNKNITRRHIRIDDDNDDNLTSLVIVCVGIVLMIVMMALHKLCWYLKRKNKDVVLFVNEEESGSSVADMAAVSRGRILFHLLMKTALPIMLLYRWRLI